MLSCLWIPYIAGVVKYEGPLTPDDYINLRENSKSPSWVRRANRAHVRLRVRHRCADARASLAASFTELHVTESGKGAPTLR